MSEVMVKFESLNAAAPPAPVPGGTWADRGTLLQKAQKNRNAVKLAVTIFKIWFPSCYKGVIGAQTPPRDMKVEPMTKKFPRGNGTCG